MTLPEDEVWRDAQLSLNQLASLAGTNRTRVCQLVQEAGYKGYKDFVNRRRIIAFLQMAKEGKLLSVQDGFYSVGYQSLMTGLRHFKAYIGLTPTEYLHRLAEEGEKGSEELRMGNND